MFTIFIIIYIDLLITELSVSIITLVYVLLLYLQTDEADLQVI